MDIQQEGKRGTTAARASSWCTRLYFNYTAGCESLVQSRCFSLSLPLSFSFHSLLLPSQTSRGAPPKCEEIKTGGEQAGRPTASALWTVSVGFSIGLLQLLIVSLLFRFPIVSSLSPLRSFLLYRVFCRFSAYFLGLLPPRDRRVLCPTLSRPAFIIDALRHCSFSLALSFFRC